MGPVRNFLDFFRKSPRTVEEVLGASILRVYIGGTDIFQTAIKLWIWTLLSNWK